MSARRHSLSDSSRDLSRGPSFRDHFHRHRALSIALGLALVLGAALGYASIGPLGPGARAGATRMQSEPVHSGVMKGGGGGATVRSSKPVPALSPAQQQSLRERQAMQQAADARNLTLKNVPTMHEANPGKPLPNPAPGKFSGCGNPCFDLVNNPSPGAVGSSPMTPSAAANGKVIWLAGNTFSKYSLNNGATWGDTISPAGLEPNVYQQQVLYEPSRNLMLWEMENFAGYGNAANELGLLVTDGQLGSYCFFHLPPTSFGLASGTTLEWSQLSYGTDYGYISAVALDGTGTFIESIVIKYDLNASSTFGSCPGSSAVAYLITSGVWMLNATEGDTDTAYFGSSWFNGGLSGNTGNHLFLVFWKESTGAVTSGTFAIDPFIPYTYTQANCSSQDAVVTNWCSITSSARGTGYRSRAGYKGKGSPLLAFAFNAQANPGSGLPYPYTVREYFNLYNVTYQGHENVWNANVAILMPAMTVTNNRGYVGGAYVYGGGVNGVGDWYPSTLLFYEDPINNGPYGNYQYILNGANNGDMGRAISARQLSPDAFHVIAAGYFIDGGGNPTPQVFEFGEWRDHYAYLRWSTT